MSLLPASFLFRYSIPVKRIDRLPRAKAPVLKLPKSCEIPFPSEMDDVPQFAKLAMAWNSEGLALAVTVSGKTDWPNCSPDAPHSADRIQIWFDTRDTQNIHRASRYCHRFVLLPIGEGSDGMEPFLKQVPVPRASEDAPDIDIDSVLLESEADQSGYRVAVWFPTESLQGFDPETYSRLGFYITVHDDEHGQQVFTLGDDFPYESDPSMWASLELDSGTD
ncbi:hypothetical protein KOR42_21910 [Thalassoglobus neptunius]|uniref:Carbohydrate-binding domain-containing protein n=1 Tax=Thalassoglobus neptunius TaxID=1938619 RepID=A0A5C5X9H0_9PLAN|nr:hypothetical protein [Thalassoglobus neptunius]TWT58805.1 hypothetical protein KOR42_21910 [Thalassoglobus neptunius]